MQTAVGIDIDVLCGSPAPASPIIDIDTLCGAEPAESEALGDVYDYYNAGLSAFEIAKLLEIDITTTRKKIAGIRPIRKDGTTRYYDLKQVLPRLVVSEQKTEQMWRNAKPAEMPPKMQKAFWDGVMQEAKYRLEVGELWNAKDMVFILASIYKEIKSNFLIWPDQMLEEGNITTEMRPKLGILLDGLLIHLRSVIYALAAENTTDSYLDQFNKLNPLPQLGESNGE